MSDVILMVVITVAIFTVVALNAWVVADPHRVVGTVAALLVLSQFSPVGIRANLGSFSVEAGDLLALSLFIASTRQIIKGGYIRPPRLWICSVSIYLILFIGSVARGILEGTSIQTIANSTRGATLTLALIVYFTFNAPHRLEFKKALNIATAGAIGCAGVASARFTGLLPLIGTSFGDEVPRPIASSPTMFLASIAILCWFASSTNDARPYQRWVPILFSILVIIMQHRSVWTASLCMVLCILLFDRSGRKQAFRGVSLAVGALTLLLTLGSSTPVARALASSADRAIAQEDTVEWRYQSWDAMMSPAFMGGTINYVIGRPRGESLARRVGNQTVDVQAHNYYVTLVELVGLAGLLANLIILGFMVPSFIKSDGIARGLSIVLIGQFVYWVSYGQTPELALLIGIAYSLWRQQGIVSPRTLLAKGR